MPNESYPYTAGSLCDYRAECLAGPAAWHRPDRVLTLLCLLSPLLLLL